MALGEKEKKQLMFLVIAIPILLAAAYYMLWWQERGVELAATRLAIDSIQLRVDSAKKDLARGTVESMRQRVNDYQAQLTLMRKLVPEGNELPSLLDDISARAKRRGVDVSGFSPMTTAEAAGTFQVYRYKLTVTGHYDQVGEFLSDVASLPRILVPYDVTVTAAKATGAKMANDTTGALLEASFTLRTFVKPETVDSTRAAGGGTHVP